jgi:hypothetical protein
LPVEPDEQEHHDRNTATTSQAPSVNFTTAKITTTSAVYIPAVKLITRRRRQAGSLVLRWYLAIPNPAIENPVNTPMA